MKHIEQGQQWVFTGEGPSKGLPHLVCWAQQGEVIAWSMPGASSGGFTWRSTADVFRQQFERVK